MINFEQTYPVVLQMCRTKRNRLGFELQKVIMKVPAGRSIHTLLYRA